MSAQVIQIPFNQLKVSELNVRIVSPSKPSDAQLMASILSDGILQNLVVVESEPSGDYEVIAGGRRFAAVGQLIKSGKLTQDFALPCLVKPINEAKAVSLAENIMREDMHPADIFVAYKSLKDQGKTEKEIAKHFGDSAIHVKKMLRLSSVAPELIQVFRSGELDLEDVMAFTVSTDHKAQLACWKEVASRPSAHRIRQILLNTNIDTSDSRLKFVTLKDYKSAGGTTVTDLFQETEYINDEELLDRLVEEKLSAVGKELEVAGWKWVKIEADGYDEVPLYSFSTIDIERVNPPEEMLVELGNAQTLLEECEDLPYSPENQQKCIELEDRILCLNNNLDLYCEYTDEHKSHSGCIVTYSTEGGLLVLRGLISSADRQTLNSGSDDDEDEDFDSEFNASSPENDESDSGAAPEPSVKYSQTLQADLNNYYRQGLQAELVQHNDLAYDLLVFAMANRLLGASRQWETPLTIQFDYHQPTGLDIEDTGAAKTLNAAKNKLDLTWLDSPKSGERFDAFCALSPEKKASILTYCVAITSLGSPASCTESRAPVLHRVVQKTGFDLRKYWQPNQANYFSRLDKANLLNLGTSLAGEDFAKQQASAKKAELTTIIESMPEIRGWLPDYLK